jgi:hypothetical protein
MKILKIINLKNIFIFFKIIMGVIEQNTLFSLKNTPRK